MSTLRMRSADGDTRAMQIARWSLICTALVFFASSWFTAQRIFVLIAVPLLIWVFIQSLKSPLRQPHAKAVLIAALAILVYDLIDPRIIGRGRLNRDELELFARLADVVWISIGGILLHRLSRSRGGDVKWKAAIIAFAGISSSMLIVMTPQPSIDVWHLHKQAGDVLFAGADPFTDIHVASSFEADDDTRFMTGYPYSPPNLIGFGASSALTGDSRWFSAACWVAFLAMFALLRPRSPTGAALLLFLASQPAWQVVLEIAYTESLTLLLLGSAIAAWRFRKTLSAVILGVALASKQYLVVLAPMLIGTRLLPVQTRLVSSLSALTTVAIGFFWSVTEYIDATVIFHLRVPPQAHSANLFGITSQFGIPIQLPAIFGLVASVVIGLLTARVARSPAQLLVGAATALGVGFFFASQALANYWFLVGAVLTMALALSEPQEVPSEPVLDNAQHAALELA